MTTLHNVPVPAICPPRWRATTVVGLLTWRPTERTNMRRFGHWRVIVDLDTGERDIYHYLTLMLIVTVQGDVTYASTGHGSVSDQGMLNRLFQALQAPYYFSRRGGAEITEVVR